MGCRVRGSFGAGETPLPVTPLHLRVCVKTASDSLLLAISPLAGDSRRGIFQLGSLAGAAHIRNNSESVLSGAQTRQKRVVAHKGKSSIDFVFQY